MTTSPASAVADKFRNPILPGFNPDPSICYVPGKGYFVATSSFEYFPGLPVYHSTDLNSWKVSSLTASSISSFRDGLHSLLLLEQLPVHQLT